MASAEDHDPFPLEIERDELPASSALSEQEIENVANGLMSLDQQVVTSTVKLLAKQEDSDLGRHPTVRKNLVHVILSGTEEAVLWACHAICSLGQVDPLTRIQLGRTPGLHLALRDAIQLRRGAVRVAACTALAALSEVQCEKSSAERIASTPGMLEVLVEVMSAEDDEGVPREFLWDAEILQLSRERVGSTEMLHRDRVLHNASNCERVAAAILNTPGMLRALRHLSVGPRCKYWDEGCAEPELTCASINAMCAINNLAKHPSVRHRIRETEPGFLCGLSRARDRELTQKELLLGRLLTDLESGKPLPYRKVGVDAGGEKAILVAAVMSAAKLSTERELAEMRIASSQIASIVLCLRKGVSGEAWQGILWSVTDCVLPLLPLANSEHHRRLLVQCGVLPILLQVMARWSSRRDGGGGGGGGGGAGGAGGGLGGGGGGGAGEVCTRAMKRKRRKVAHGWGGGGQCAQTEAATCGGEGGGREGGREVVAEDLERRWNDERQQAVHLCLLLTARMSVDDTPHLLRTRSAIATLRVSHPASLCATLMARSPLKARVGQEVGRSLREEEDNRPREHAYIEASSTTWPLRDRNIALCMGSHLRLGSDPSCLIGLLDVSLLRLILEKATTSSALAFNLALALSHADAV